MQNVTLIGIHLGKPSFHLHGQDRQGKTLLRKKFSRKQLVEFLAAFHACTIVMEAICEAACPPSMRLGAPKTLSRQCLSALHRVRESLVVLRLLILDDVNRTPA